MDMDSRTRVTSFTRQIITVRRRSMSPGDNIDRFNPFTVHALMITDLASVHDSRKSQKILFSRILNMWICTGM